MCFLVYKVQKTWYNFFASNTFYNYMKIKPNLELFTDDFWYDLIDGGYLKPENIMEDVADIDAVLNAIKMLKRFRNACEEQIDNFI
jgi:hypothetical protein